MRLKSLHTPVTNQRIKRTCVANIVMLCLLSGEVWSYANMKQHRFVRQLNAETAVNYENTAMTNSYHQPHFTGNRTVVVQLFEWKFVDIAAECRNFLGPQGYAGVQISPVLEHTVINTSELNHPWWERYEVVSYRLASRSGDESEFWSMSRVCNEHGVRIYVDVVLNHMAAPLHYVGVTEADNEDFLLNTLLATNVNISQLNYANVSYTQQDFHRPSCMILANAQDAHEIRNCQLNGHPDLDHSKRNVQKQIVEMLNKFVEMGVAGFRIDTAKHIWPIDLKNILKQVKNLNTEFNFNTNSRPFLYHDVFDLGLDTVSKTEYSTYGVVSEYLYSTELSNILQGKAPLSALINWGPALGFLPHEDSLVFIDSHDTQRGLPRALNNNHVLTYRNRIKYIMANVFMLVHPYGGIKRIMSSYYFPATNINQGPPVLDTAEEEIRSPEFNDQQQCTQESGWVCEHRWPELLNMLKVANYFQAPENKEGSVIYFQTGGPNQVAFCRGYKAFVAINNDPEMDFVKEVYACLEPGIYCDVVTGGKREGAGKEECRGKILEINEQGYMKLELAVADDGGGGDEDELGNEGEEEAGTVASYGILVIYVESKIGTTEDPAEIKADGNEKATAAEEGNQAEIKSEENGLKENAEEVNKIGNDIEDTAQKDDKNNEDDIEQAEANNNGTPTEEGEEEKDGAEGENQGSGNKEDNTPKGSVENASTSEHEQANETKEKDSNETEEKKKDEQNTENGDPQETEDEEKMKEKEVEEQDSKAVEENPYQEIDQHASVETAEEKNETGAEVEQVDLVQGDSVENKPNDIVKEPREEPKTVEDNNQSRNINENTAEAEEQIEKPSAEIVDSKNDISDAVTAKIQDIQTAGIFAKSKGDGNDG